MTLILFKIKHSSLMIIFQDSWTTELVEAYRICVARIIIVWLLSTRILYKERRTRDRSVPNFSDPLLILITPKSVLCTKYVFLKQHHKTLSLTLNKYGSHQTIWWLDAIVIYCILLRDAVFARQKYKYRCTDFLPLVLGICTFAKNRWYQELTHH